MRLAVPESQRDSVPKPRVAEPARLPWVMRCHLSQPQRGCVHRRAVVSHREIYVQFWPK
jgi:hypothetical protein